MPGLPLALARRLCAECLGTGLLVTVVVGSGIAAQRLSPGDTGLQLLENSSTTALGLAVLILAFGPVSGAHFNPVVSLADWYLGRHARTGLSLADVAAYTIAQCTGAIGGAVLANVMFGVGTGTSGTHRASGGHLIGEVVATAGLITLIHALARAHRATLAGPAVGAYIGAAYWFTSSTGFANPAVTIGRMFTDTFAGIHPASVPSFISMQLIGAVVGVGIVLVLYPATASRAHQMPHDHADARHSLAHDAAAHDATPPLRLRSQPPGQPDNDDPGRLVRHPDPST